MIYDFFFIYDKKNQHSLMNVYWTFNFSAMIAALVSQQSFKQLLQFFAVQLAKSNKHKRKRNQLINIRFCAWKSIFLAISFSLIPPHFKVWSLITGGFIEYRIWNVRISEHLFNKLYIYIPIKTCWEINSPVVLQSVTVLWLYNWYF